MPFKLRGKQAAVDEPVMSDLTILVSVEDLINIAMGPAEGNTVNFKMIQTVLHILARQMRLLETKVDIKIADVADLRKKKKKESQYSSESPLSDASHKREHMEEIEEEKSPKSGKKKEKSSKDKNIDAKEKGGKKYKSARDRDSDEKAKAKEKEKLDNMPPKEREQYVKEKKTRQKQKDHSPDSDSEKESLQKTVKSVKEEEQNILDHKVEQQKITPKEKELILKEKEQEGKALEKMTPKEKEKYLKEKNKQIPKATGSGTSIAITEVERQNEKVLIVEKGPTTRAASKTRVGSIEVVTLSQFNVLAGQVEQLKQIAAPLPMPALPDNRKLKADLVKGSASLTDTMQAMQVSARVQAAEAGLARMAGLLTQLAASGALPEYFAEQLEAAKAEMEVLRTNLKGEARTTTKGPGLASQNYRKSVAIDPLVTETGTGSGSGTATSTGTGSRPSSAATDKRASVAAISVASRYSRPSVARHSRPSIGRPIAVTRNEMDDAIQSLRDDMTKTMQSMTYRAASSAETAAGTAKGIADKMDIALKLNNRISDLYALTSEYAEQLSGFDAGLTTQMQSFQEQMMQMREDLKAGLIQLDTANNNVETAAVLELTERYVGLQGELEASLVEHQHLAAFQKRLGDELRGLVEAVETLKEQKADRDEVWDGLRDKADLSQLSGLLTEEDFALSRAGLDVRLDVCYDKFNKQETVWMTALKDLTEVTMGKAELMQLLSIRDNAQDHLRDVQEKVRQLTIQLGEPKAAILTRLLSKDGACGACRVPALMEVTDPRAGLPPALPGLRPRPDGEPDGTSDAPCAPVLTPIVIQDENTKSHICTRWVGGSYTLVPRSAPREMAPAQVAPAPPVYKYTGYGADGKLYNMEEELQPCGECNKLTTEHVKRAAGAGDAADRGDATQVCECIWPDE